MDRLKVQREFDKLYQTFVACPREVPRSKEPREYHQASRECKHGKTNRCRKCEYPPRRLAACHEKEESPTRSPKKTPALSEAQWDDGFAEASPALSEYNWDDMFNQSTTRPATKIAKDNKQRRVCLHGKRRDRCVRCEGAHLCTHGRLKFSCRTCRQKNSVGKD